MTPLHPTEKLRLIYQLLFDLATGSRTVVFEVATPTDSYDELFVALSLYGERLRKLVLEHGAVPPYFVAAPSTPLLFVLDATYRIIDLNATAAERLHYPPSSLRFLLFEELLAVSSKMDWLQLHSKVRGKVRFFETVTLRFVTLDRYQLPLHCVVTDAVLQQVIFVFSTDIHWRMASVLTTSGSSSTDEVKNEVAVAEKVHAYILHHLEDPLPSLKSLALLFGIEEHKLRNGFRRHYQSSIYQFYHEERLKKAYLLIQQTDLPLKEIAYQCGFGMYLNFYKAFKKKYGFSPSALSRG